MLGGCIKSVRFPSERGGHLTFVGGLLHLWVGSSIFIRVNHFSFALQTSAERSLHTVRPPDAALPEIGGALSCCLGWVPYFGNASPRALPTT